MIMVMLTSCFHTAWSIIGCWAEQGVVNIVAIMRSSVNCMLVQ